MTDKTSNIIFPYMRDDFDGKEFLKNRDNFALKKHIKSIKIFEMQNIAESNMSDSANRGGQYEYLKSSKSNITQITQSPKSAESNTTQSTIPLFTIAIPTYNRLETLKEALDSALNQDIDFREFESDIGKNISKKSYEIIVVENVDDFSTKSKAQEMLENEYFGKVTYYKNEANLGLFGNWNRCIELAKGKWVCLLHSDDLLMPNYLREMKNALSKLNDKKVGMVSSNSENFGEKIAFSQDALEEEKLALKNKTLLGKIKKQLKNILFHSSLQDFEFSDKSTLIYPATRPSALLHNKNLCLKFGGYNQNEYPMGDIYGALRCARTFGIAHYNVKTNCKRIDISQGMQKNLCYEYSLQHYYFIKDCTNFLSAFKRYNLIYLLEWPLETNPQNRALTNDFYAKFHIKTNFSFFDKIQIFVSNFFYKTKRIFKCSRFCFGYKAFLKE